MKELIIATRKSKLAQVQTERVMELIKEKENINLKKLLVVTEGDRRLDVTLDKIGGKGVFTKERISRSLRTTIPRTQVMTRPTAIA